MRLLLSIMMFFVSFASTGVGDATIIASRCYLYSSASFDSEIVKVEDDDYYAKLNDVFVIESYDGDFAFAHNKSTPEIKGYIYKYYLTQNSSQTVYPVFNASIRNDTTLFDVDKNEVSTVLKNTRVYIYAGFNDKEEYTPVQIVLEDGSLYNGLILTKDVNPDGVSSLLIVAISVISACVTVVLSVVFIKKSKDKQKKKRKILKKNSN